MSSEEGEEPTKTRTPDDAALEPVAPGPIEPSAPAAEEAAAVEVIIATAAHADTPAAAAHEKEAASGGEVAAAEEVPAAEEAAAAEVEPAPLDPPPLDPLPLADAASEDWPTMRLAREAELADAEARGEVATLDGEPSPEGGEPDDVPPDPGSADAASPRLQSIVESLLFAADKPLTLKGLAELIGESDLPRVRAAVAAIEQHHESRGFQLHQVAGGYQFRTHPANATWVQKLLAQKPVRLSRPQLETLAICAYRQPITRPEIDEIRGVDSGGTLKTLMERALVRIVGKKEEPGRPLLYGTTREFLEFFNLGDLKDLPTLREFHELSEEHKAQVAALEGVAPAGTIEGQGETPAPPTEPSGPPPLTRLEINTAIEDEAELEEIDRLIRNAGSGLVTDSDQPPPGGEAEPEAAPPAAPDFDANERTRVHPKTILSPDNGEAEFDVGEETNPRPGVDLAGGAHHEDEHGHDDDEDDDHEDHDHGPDHNQDDDEDGGHHGEGE